MMKLIDLFLMPSHPPTGVFPGGGRERKGDVDVDLGLRVTAAAGSLVFFDFFFWQPNIFPARREISRARVSFGELDRRGGCNCCCEL